MAAATHMVGSAHSYASSASISPPPLPWHPVVIVPNHQHQALYDLDLTPSPSPSPFPTTPATASPARHNHHEQHLRRRAGKRRRPRPSRKLPTTYIRADAASFRRMVHQVTGADNVAAHQDQAATVELLCRPGPAPPLSRAALTTTMILPTLDTSAFLLGVARGPMGGGGATPARTAGVSCCHGSTVPAVGDPGAALRSAEEACCRGGVRGADYSCSYSNNDGTAGGGFESWDDNAIFQE